MAVKKDFSELLRYNLGRGVEAFSTRRESVLPYPVITGHQVHDCRVAIVDRQDLTRDDLDGYDAFVTSLPGCAVGVRTADCVPVLLYDPVKEVVATIPVGSTDWHDCAFFRIKAFKKGTIHLEFKDEDIWNRFNIAVNKGKNERGMAE